MHDKKREDVLKKLGSKQTGLTNREAKIRLSKFGRNEIVDEEPINPWKILLSQFNSPLVWLLIAAALISLAVNHYVDASVIAVILVINAVLGFVQEYNAEQSIEALKKMASPHAKVIRNNQPQDIASALIVPGDIILLETGDKVPADSRLLEVHDFFTQEATLTGESFPIEKTTDALPTQTTLADRTNMVFSGTIITRGRAKAVVTSTAMSTEIGKIATMITKSHEKFSPLQKKLHALGTFLTITVAVIAVIVFLAGIMRGEPALQMFLVAVALAVAAIPEGLPAVITISLAMGVKKMIKNNALIRKLPSVETLGSVSVICSDKTGTLTRNEMTITKIWVNNQEYDVTGSGYKKEGQFEQSGKKVSTKSFSKLLQIGMLCNNAKLNGEKQVKVIGDPTEAALIISANKAGFESDKLNGQFKRVDELSFTSERKRMTTIYDTQSYTKGAPDIILELCDRISINGRLERLTRQKRKEIHKQIETFGSEALRVLGFAYNDKIEKPEANMIFVGLQAMIDPPRQKVKVAIKTCQTAGIRVVMITGDHLQTAQAIGKEIGITGKAITGLELEQLKNLNKEIEHINIFARVNPEHKLKIIEALKNKGHVIAMTGDGVNDAPALKKADIGISMGISGTDVAKEASDMILTDDHFESIVKAIKQGRGIFDNIRKFVNYLLSSNLGEVLLIFLATLFGMPLPLTAVQILWVNLVTDGLPAVALGMDPPEKDIMLHKPRPANEHIVSKNLLFRLSSSGILIGITTLLLFMFYLPTGIIKAQTIAFTALVVFEIVRLYNIRSHYNIGWFANKFLIVAVAISISLQLLVLYSPLKQFFGTALLSVVDWLYIATAAIVLVTLIKITEKVKNVIISRNT